MDELNAAPNSTEPTAEELASIAMGTNAQEAGTAASGESSAEAVTAGAMASASQTATANVEGRVLQAPISGQAGFQAPSGVPSPLASDAPAVAALGEVLSSAQSLNPSSSDAPSLAAPSTDNQGSRIGETESADSSDSDDERSVGGGIDAPSHLLMLDVMLAEIERKIGAGIHLFAHEVTAARDHLAKLL